MALYIWHWVYHYVIAGLNCRDTKISRQLITLIGRESEIATSAQSAINISKSSIAIIGHLIIIIRALEHTKLPGDNLEFVAIKVVKGAKKRNGMVLGISDSGLFIIRALSGEMKRRALTSPETRFLYNNTPASREAVSYIKRISSIHPYFNFRWKGVLEHYYLFILIIRSKCTMNKRLESTYSWSWSWKMMFDLVFIVKKKRIHCNREDSSDLVVYKQMLQTVAVTSQTIWDNWSKFYQKHSGISLNKPYN